MLVFSLLHTSKAMHAMKEVPARVHTLCCVTRLYNSNYVHTSLSEHRIPQIPSEQELQWLLSWPPFSDAPIWSNMLHLLKSLKNLAVWTRPEVRLMSCDLEAGNWSCSCKSIQVVFCFELYIPFHSIPFHSIPCCFWNSWDIYKIFVQVDTRVAPGSRQGRFSWPFFMGPSWGHFAWDPGLGQSRREAAAITHAEPSCDMSVSAWTTGMEDMDVYQVHQVHQVHQVYNEETGWWIYIDWFSMIFAESIRIYLLEMRVQNESDVLSWKRC